MEHANNRRDQKASVASHESAYARSAELRNPWVVSPRSVNALDERQRLRCARVRS